jgi:hypothetical protein
MSISLQYFVLYSADGAGPSTAEGGGITGCYAARSVAKGGQGEQRVVPPPGAVESEGRESGLKMNKVL